MPWLERFMGVSSYWIVCLSVWLSSTCLYKKCNILSVVRHIVTKLEMYVHLRVAHASVILHALRVGVGWV